MKTTLIHPALFLFMMLFFTSPGWASSDMMATESDQDNSVEKSTGYENYAQRGSYISPSWVGEVPEWHYYDPFGNPIVDGFYLYNMSVTGNSTANIEQSNIALSPILKKWLNGMVQVGDIVEDHGILALVGDRVSSTFTPFTLNQSLFNGARIDAFSNFLYGMNSVSFINSRISSTGLYGMFMEQHVIEPGADWLRGAHFNKNVKEIIDVGATWVTMHNQVDGGSGSFNGTRNDSFPNTVTALKILGINGQCKVSNISANGEWAQSQEIVDGVVKQHPGSIGMINASFEIPDRLKVSGEGYMVQARYKTTFSDPAFPKGDIASQKYLYSLVDDNDDHDQFPENGQEGKINFLPLGGGDMDGVLSELYDKDKNNRYDWEEDFLSYDCDPPRSDIYFDKNNNNVPDEIEDDPYPDYPYVPGYYLSGERYLRKIDSTGVWINDVVRDSAENSFNMDRQVSKGLSGFHLYGQYQLLPGLELALGAKYEKSEKSSFQMTYANQKPIGYIFAQEQATDLYSIAGYRHDFAADKKLTARNYVRFIKDNIPNHTVVSRGGLNTVTFTNDMLFTTVEDELEYRDAVVEMLAVQYDIYRNRGFNFTTRGKFEFTKHLPQLEFNYTDKSISSLVLLNKGHYIWLLPVLKDMFLIPKFKSIYERGDYDTRTPMQTDAKYRRNTLSNNAYLVYDWKFTEKTSVTTGLQGQVFNDLNNGDESFFHGNWTAQVMIKDRYAGMSMILTTGVSLYTYNYANDATMVFNPVSNLMEKIPVVHDPMNNPYRITGDANSYDVFFKIHCGF